MFDAKKETKALEEKEAYMQTKKYIEDEAKDKKILEIII